MDNKIKLTNPIKWGNEIIEELTFRNSTAKDLRPIILGAMKFGDLLDLAAKLSGYPPSVLDQLSMSDVGRVTASVGELLNHGV